MDSPGSVKQPPPGTPGPVLSRCFPGQLEKGTKELCLSQLTSGGLGGLVQCEVPGALRVP